jgi:hypothetical protein
VHEIAKLVVQKALRFSMKMHAVEKWIFDWRKFVSFGAIMCV